MNNNNDEILLQQISHDDTLIKPEKRLFRNLKQNEMPLIPYEDMEVGIYIYQQHVEQKCAICTSSFRNIAEHIFLDNGKKPASVVKFFDKHFGATLNHNQVKTHMDFHCDFKNLSISGLKTYEGREEDVEKWKWREYDFALTALLVEIDDIRGINAKSPDLLIRRSQMIEKLLGRIITLREKRDQAMLGVFNIFEILKNAYDLLLYEDDKLILKNYIKELQDQIRNN